MIPGRYVTSVTLNEDLDLRNWGTPVFGSGVVIDLHGKHLYVDNLDGTVWQYARFVNTDSDTTATVEVRVNSGMVSDTTATVEGNVKFVKAGAGTFVVRFGQTYTGGTEVAGGTLKAGVAGTINPLARGVYAVDTPLGRGIANWGVAPTMGDRAWPEPVLEVHLLTLHKP